LDDAGRHITQVTEDDREKATSINVNSADLALQRGRHLWRIEVS